MTGQKLLRGNISVYAVDPSAVAKWTAPTAAELNTALTDKTIKAWDISCAINDDSYSINLTDSDTDDSRSICDISNVDTPTFFQYEVEFDTFRNGPAAGPYAVPQTAVYDLPLQLFTVLDREFYIVKRIGVPQGVALAKGQTISAYGVTVDYAQDIVDDNSVIQFGARFKTTGNVNVNFDLL